MEEKTNTSFFKFISNQRLKIPILETGIIHNDYIESLIVNDESGFIQRKPYKSLRLLSYLQQLSEENELKNRLVLFPNLKICYIYKRGERKVYEDTFIKEYLIKNKIKRSAFEIIQKCLYATEEKIYLLKVSYYANQYHTNFTTGKNQVTDPIAISSMIDMLKMIMSCIELLETKRIIQMKIEFIRDNNGILWLMNCSKCLLIEAKYTLNEHLITEAHLDSFIKKMRSKVTDDQQKFKKKVNKYYKMGLNKDEEGGVESSYTFTRGQLRNKSSNLGSPIRIKSPEFPEEVFSTRRDTGRKISQILAKSKKFLFESLQSKLPKLISRIDSQNKKLVFSDAVNNYLKINKHAHSEIPLQNTENRAMSLQKSEKSLSEFHYNPISKRKSYQSVKSLSKLPKINNNLSDGGIFMELILKTYFKEKDLGDFNNQEFGIDHSLSSEIYSKFLHIINSPILEEENSLPDKNSQHLMKPIFEEILKSRPLSPDCGINKRNSSNLIIHKPEIKHSIRILKNIHTAAPTKELSTILSRTIIPKITSFTTRS